MSQDDPFAALPSDLTIVIPSPGQRGGRPAATPSAAIASAGVAADTEAFNTLVHSSGGNPLVAAAIPLLSVVPTLRCGQQPDPVGLRDALAQAIRDFETRAKAAGCAPESVIGARYSLCTLLDETAASTPWGGSGVWAGQGLLVLFHNETWGGEKFFQLLAKLAENPQKHHDLLELMYLCLTLGFEGRFRVQDNGRAQLDALRERLYGLLKNPAKPIEAELSPHWQGVVNLRNPLLGWLPLWVTGTLLGLLLLVVYLGFSYSLNRASDPLYSSIQGLRAPTIVAAEPAVPPPAAKPRLVGLLAADISAGRVGVQDFADSSVVTIRGDGLFEPASATLSETYQPLIERIGSALARLPGSVLITGHTDDQPIRSLRFPSNWHLSQARADTVRELLATQLAGSRLRAEGRAESQPLARDTSAEGRARNRRVEITLYAKPQS